MAEDQRASRLIGQMQVDLRRTVRGIKFEHHGTELAASPPREAGQPPDRRTTVDLVTRSGLLIRNLLGWPCCLEAQLSGLVVEHDRTERERSGLPQGEVGPPVPILEQPLAAPRNTGLRIKRYSSIKPSRMNVDAVCAPAKRAMSLPGCCFRRLISAATSPLRTWQFSQVAQASRFETTYLGSSIMRRAASAWRPGSCPSCLADVSGSDAATGQNSAKSSYATRPNTIASIERSESFVNLSESQDISEHLSEALTPEST
jgi:hypothetical protein